MTSEKIDKRYLSILSQIEEQHAKNDESSFDINSRVLIIDGLNTFIRAFSANPSLNDDGVHIGGIIGFLKSLRFTLNRIKPTRCIIVFDGMNGAKRRRKLYPEYKGNRKVKRGFNRNVDWGTAPQDEDQSMKLQLGRLIRYLEELPVSIVSIDYTEADDIIAYISQQLLVDSRIIIMSTDQDFYQLISDRVTVWSPTKKIEYTTEKIFLEFGIQSENFLTYRVLSGDKSDNIPGIQGAGLKTIKKYIKPITENSCFNVKDLINFSRDTDLNYKLIENIKNNELTLKRNYLLMQLDKVDISNHNKRYTQQALKREIPRLVKYKFSTMFMQDKLWGQIPDMDSWLIEFVRLDRFGGIYGD
jgi:5'-3' exonuclease